MNGFRCDWISIYIILFLFNSENAASVDGNRIGNNPSAHWMERFALSYHKNARSYRSGGGDGRTHSITFYSKKSTHDICWYPWCTHCMMYAYVCLELNANRDNLIDQYSNRLCSIRWPPKLLCSIANHIFDS